MLVHDCIFRCWWLSFSTPHSRSAIHELTDAQKSTQVQHLPRLVLDKVLAVFCSLSLCNLWLIEIHLGRSAVVKATTWQILFLVTQEDDWMVSCGQGSPTESLKILASSIAIYGLGTKRTWAHKTYCRKSWTSEAFQLVAAEAMSVSWQWSCDVWGSPGQMFLS